MPIALAPVAVALLLLLIVVGAIYMLRAVTLPFQQLPDPIGSTIRNTIGAAADTAAKFASGWLDTAAAPFIDLLTGIVSRVYVFLQGVVNGITYVLGETVSLAYQASHLSTLVDWVQQQAQAYTDQSSAQAQHYARQLVLNEAADRAAAVAQAEAKVQTYAAGLAWQLTQAYTADIAVAEAQAKADVADGVRAAETAAAAAVRPFETGLTDLEAQLGNLSGVLAGLGVSSLALAIPQILTDVETLRRDLRDCCGPSGTPKPPNLTGILDATALLAMFGFVAEGIANPEGTAELAAQAGDELSGFARDAAGLVGLRV